MNVWQRQQSLNIQKGKEGTLQLVVVAVHHLWMMSLQIGEKQQTSRSIQILSKHQLLINQGKQPVLIVNEDPSSENPTPSSTMDILKSIDDESNKEEYGSKISDPLAHRVEGK